MGVLPGWAERDLAPPRRAQRSNDDRREVHLALNTHRGVPLSPHSETPSKKADPVTTNDTAKADAGKSVEVGKSPVKTKASYVIPANWHAKESASTGERYYFNSVTGESAWRHPGEDVALILLDAKWRAFILYLY